MDAPSTFLVPPRSTRRHLHLERRGEMRHAVSIGCVLEREYWRLFAGQIIDLSPEGMLVQCEARLDVGAELVVTFKATGMGVRFVTRAVVTRVVAGRRRSDAGRAVGLRFVGLSAVSRLILRGILHALPAGPASREPPPDPPPAAEDEEDVDYASIIAAALADAGE
ncbi:MAG: PilZ domain-containing protein [Polyangiaceae bacterium]